MINIKLDRNTWQIELLILNSNILNHLNVFKQMINIKWNNWSSIIVFENI